LGDYAKAPGEPFEFFPNTLGLEPFPGTGARMRAYEAHAAPLALAAVRQTGATPETLASITHLITVSCTGMYAPGLDLDLVQQLNLAPHVQRFAINFMGCYAAFNALKLADALCRADSTARVLVVAVELCSLHFQKNSSEDNLLANAIFADGAAAVLLQAAHPKWGHRGPSLCLDHFFCGLETQGRPDMAWYIRDSGFEMRLSAYVPDLLAGRAQELTGHLLAQLPAAALPVELYAIHPGGRRILQALEKAMDITPAQNWASYQVLRQYGNMSSATVLFVLQQYLQLAKPAHAGKPILSMAFGPGLVMEAALLRLVMD
jgi:predicted naringenin-chalcone synthase